MKRNIKTLSMLFALLIALTSCGGGGAKVAKSLQKVVSSKSVGKAAGKAAKGVGRSADDVARHFKTTKVTCTTCAGLKQVDFVDEYGNYQYTGICPDCDGEGTVTKYEFK